MMLRKIPDRVLNVRNIFSSELDTPTAIRPIELDSYPPRSVPFMFDKICELYPSRVALNYKCRGQWQEITYGKYHELVKCCAKGFISLGLTPNAVVCILGFNAPEWFISDLGAIYAGGVASGIYTTNSPQACLHCLNNSRAVIVVVEGRYVDKILEVKSMASSVRAVIQYGAAGERSGVIDWENFMKIGERLGDDILRAARSSIAVNKCCTLVYTSGTTGSPKGAMLSHDNVVYDALKIGERLGLSVNPAEIYVSYLPLSHVAGNVVDIHCSFNFAVKVYFADKDALKGTLVSTMAEVRPTRVLSVPRVWEKFYESFKGKSASATWFKKCISNWAKKEGLRKNLAKERRESYRGSYWLAKALIFNSVKKTLGIQNCKSIICGAAPLAVDLKHYFASLDIIILDAFGMSESSALHCCCTVDDFKFESCGKACKGMISKIDGPDEDGNGELCMYGRHVFMGYIHDEERTREIFDKEGFLRSGDIACIDGQGFILITGRLKEIIITAGGENVAPILIEQQIKAALPFVGHAVLVGDRRKYLTVLLTLSCQVDEHQKPTPNLSPAVREWLSSIGLSYSTMEQVNNSGPDQKILLAIQDGIDEANKNAISNAQKVKKFVLLESDFSIGTGELGPTMKVKRDVVVDKYKDLIEKAYDEIPA